MKSILAIIVSISLYNCILGVEFQDCSADGKVTGVTVSGCSDSDSACKLQTGTDATINIKFTSNVDSSSNTVKMWGIINGITIPFPASQSDACQMGLSCPVKSGSSQELKVSMPVSSSYPKIALKVKIAVVDSNGANLVCSQFPAQIA